ncbi:MAG: hypothetical protein O7G29_03690 [Acidobacteria bacterium]|nr:hypothetical protein [Acidobacteriota bacterium]
MLEALVALLPLLGGLFKDTAKRRRLQDERGQAAVEAALRAVNETKLYLLELARSEHRDLDREGDLSRYWTDTAARLHGIDDDLAQRCRLKGEYWTDPDQWDEQRLKETRILLTQVATDADTLLGWEDTDS